VDGGHTLLRRNVGDMGTVSEIERVRTYHDRRFGQLLEERQRLVVVLSRSEGFDPLASSGRFRILFRGLASRSHDQLREPHGYGGYW